MENATVTVTVKGKGSSRLDDGEKSFCLLKPESYLFWKKSTIEQRIQTSGLKIVEVHKVKLSFKDILRLYKGRMARITMTLRLPHFRYLDLYILEGTKAISTMHNLKYRIRSEMLGLKMGGFVHAPDSVEEFKDHMTIFSGVKSKPAF